MKPYLLIALFALACSPEKKLARLVAKHPELVKTDTLTIRDTVYFDRVEQHVTDVFIVGDTVRIDTGRLHVRVVRLPGDSVFVSGVCDTDTVFTEIKVPCDTISPTKEVKYIPWWIYACMGALFAACAYFAIRRR